ncbi:TRAP transporter small permease subunit [Comamonas sp. NLF-1-9]|uniref:TRAP transporter small permease subunit n=1 Tax=Comamonas sp. NLF-1-9 TaxID=2853163 RepID=UPI001C44C517|nr:TRAP transporter small permease subunit [Comamonas sp. NLF-1-9]QXL84680.1 TRAP transporter small permease subunit [Comamonas sp. NLF-1-9]
MQALLSLSRAIDRLNMFIGKYAIWLIFGATVISAVNAVIRKIFNYSSNGFLEVQWYLFAWSFLIAAGYTLLKREHVRIDVLNSHFPKKVQLAIEMFGLVFFLTPVCLMVLYYVTPLTLQMYQSGEMSNNPGGLIRWPVWLALPLGFTLLLLQGWSELIKCIAFALGKGPDPTIKPDEKSDEQELIEALRQESAAKAAKPGPSQAPAH